MSANRFLDSRRAPCPSRLGPDGKIATRTQVKFGRTSVTYIEILEGLKVGDQVLLSDMSAYDGQDRIELK